jgi:hypothetical protein
LTRDLFQVNISRPIPCHTWVSGEGIGNSVDGTGALIERNIDDLITHTMPLEEINDAFELMHSGESNRSIAIY